MTQFEFDQLATMAGGWEIRSLTVETDAERRLLKSNARELRDFLRHADTSPGIEPESEPAPLPSMKNPDRLPTIPEDA